MLSPRIDQVDEALVEQLCAEKRPESQVLDFKLELPPRTPEGRAEVAKDVCAFANAGGGEVVYGVADANACASKPRPITSESSDAAKRRLQEILEARIEPRVLGLQFHDFKLGDGYGLVVRVPPSFNGPHRYADDNQVTHFVIRSGTRTSELTYPELRTAFDRTATLFERTREFRAERLATILSGRTPQSHNGGPLCACHLVPLMAMDGRLRLDIESLYYDHQQSARYRFEGWGGLSRAVNLDGLLIHDGGTGTPTSSYVQIFRSGAFESLRIIGSQDTGHGKVVWGSVICWFVRESAEKLIAAARDYGLAGPAAFGVTLTGLAEYGFRTARSLVGGRSAPPPDRPDLVIPEQWIDRVEELNSIQSVVRPSLELAYQCFNVASCDAYDVNGNWQLCAHNR